MKQIKTNRRVEKTKRELHLAMISLLHERNYDSIVVQDILDRANVGRSTFYSHFRDKDELLLKGIGNLREWLRAAQTEAGKTMDKPYEKMISFSLPMFEHIDEFRKVIHGINQSQAGPLMMQKIGRMIAELITDASQGEFEKRRKSKAPVPKEILIHYVSSTFISVMTWWLDNRNSMTPKAVNTVYRSLVLPTLAANFE